MRKHRTAKLGKPSGKTKFIGSFKPQDTFHHLDIVEFD